MSCPKLLGSDPFLGLRWERTIPKKPDLTSAGTWSTLRGEAMIMAITFDKRLADSLQRM